MNTEQDALDQQNLMALLQQVEPSWKTNRLPPDSATEVFRRPVPERRAIPSLDAPFGSVEATGGGGSSNRNGQGIELQSYECSGNLNGEAATLVLYGPPGQG